jgi:hypothetical protein
VNESDGGIRPFIQNSEVPMQCARTVLLVLLLLAGSLSPPEAEAQVARPDPAPEQELGFSLEQNYPNPVNPETFIPFRLEESLFRNSDSVVVTMRVFNILRQVVAIPEALVENSSGRRVRLLNHRFTEPGRTIAYWDGRDVAGLRVPTGAYFYELTVNDVAVAKKMIVLNDGRRRLIPWLTPRNRD